MKVTLHTEFDIFTYKAVGAVTGILAYAILAYKNPQIDLLVACVIAFLIGSLVWYLLHCVLIKKNGICIEFRYSKNRVGLASVTLSKGFKEIGFMEFELPPNVGSYNQELDSQIPSKLKHFFTRTLSDIGEFDETHFVGCTKNDIEIICQIIMEINDLTASSDKNYKL